MGTVPPFWGRGAGSPSNNVAWAEAYLHTKWHLDASSRLATIEMGRKLGRGCAPSQTIFQKIAKSSPSWHHRTTLSGYILASRQVLTIGKNLLKSNISPTSTCLSHNMVNFSPLTVEICSRIWGTPANINGFRVLAALLHGTMVVSVSQTLRR